MRLRFPRSCGILLHPTSLPSRWGIGDLGDGAYKFVDFLEASGQSLWQILPLCPTDYGNSPYQSPSAFAGNPLLISLDRLVSDQLLTPNDLAEASQQPLSDEKVDYDAVIALKLPLFERSYELFKRGANSKHNRPFEQFCSQNADWLDDYALFMALKNHHKGATWSTWEPDILKRQPAALKHWKEQLAQQIEVQKYTQYLFSYQWNDLKDYANERNIKIVGDAPIFVAYDSSDVWGNPDLFYLDSSGKSTVVAGVPPDYFSATGQLWGNPLYRWDRMAQSGYDWWIRRMKQTLALVDIVRLDHFRAFEAFWEVPASETTAMNGTWKPGPGAAFFEALQKALGELPIIAEDLGVITPEVEELRDQFHLPGMKVLQFAFGGDSRKNPYLPHVYIPNSIVYTGTHDNDTTIGWFQGLHPNERKAVQTYMGRDGSDIAWDLMRLAYMSVADMAVVPLQDVLRLGSEARQNIPGIALDNWAWRFTADMIEPGLEKGLYLFAKTYVRLPESSSDSDSEA